MDTVACVPLSSLSHQKQRSDEATKAGERSRSRGNDDDDLDPPRPPQRSPSLFSMQRKSGILATYSLDWISDDLLVLHELQVSSVLPVLLVLLVLLLEC